VSTVGPALLTSSSPFPEVNRDPLSRANAKLSKSGASGVVGSWQRLRRPARRWGGAD